MTNNTSAPSYYPPKSVSIDTSIRPQDDFFQFVNRTWLNQHPIPDSETRWGTFNVLRENSWNAMRTIYQDLQQQNPADGSIEQLAKDFYYTGMNYASFEPQHLATVNRLVASINAVSTTSDLSRVIGQLHALDIDCLWGVYVDSDHDDSTKHILYFAQSGLTLPDRDYYLDKSRKMTVIRDHYKKYGADIYAELLNSPTTFDTDWDTLLAFETQLAKISRQSEDLRDIEKNYNKTTYAAIMSDYAAIDWPEYAKALGWIADDKISVRQPEFLEYVNSLFTSESIDSVKQYLVWKVLTQCLSSISPRFSDIHFGFHGKVLSGTTEIMPLWKRVVLAAEHTIGDGTGKLYAKKHFPESSKVEVLKLVDMVRASFAERIDTLEWMSDDTKAYAKEKLENMKVLIGYPDIWRDYSDLSIRRDSYLDTILAAQQYEVAYWLERLHQPISRDDWYMTPQTVNAYHDPNRLVICFPAGILQSPFFDPSASIAANMGGIGTVIGHELTHGFDDQGCQFDAQGNVRTWQSDQERAAFNKKAQLIVDQANSFEVLPDLFLRGKLVLGESIADLGGIEIALHALKKVTSTIDQPAAISEFLINYAYTECSHVRPEKTREYTLTDPHPASEFRVNGILQHVDDFYTSFDVQSKDALFTDETVRARIW